MTAVTMLDTDRHVLAEGPAWDTATATVSWIDIEAGRVFVGRPDADDRVDVIRTLDFEERVGCAFRLGNAQFLVALERRLALVDALGTVTTSRELLPEGRRFNDGIIDPAGRLIVGGLSLTDDHTGNVLLRLEHDGNVTTLDDDLGLSNGLGFSPDGGTLYSIDSDANVVYARAYDYESGAAGARRVLARIEDATPDGMAVDSEGGLWVALWGGHGIRHLDALGHPHGDIAIDVPHVTSLAFVGSSLNRALVTTASLVLSPAEVERHPGAGMLFLVDLPVTGQPAHRWRPVALPQ
ncbi:MAG: SMP-30/gluconolactonase/LRE family protein [Microcella sp.]|uniref:SMP-30/gluconolactonase/LRE family protein n=1 Tax=Microcella sp. TaxID=1913979 RepID=UPI003314937F